MSELEEARERYKLHLAAKAHPSHEGCPYGRENRKRLSQFWDDEQLLARSACEAGEDGREQFLKQLLREARVHWYHDLDVPSAAALELKLVVDAAIDAARKGG